MGVTFSFSELIYPCPQAFPMLALSPGPSLPKSVLVLTVHACTKFFHEKLCALYLVTWRVKHSLLELEVVMWLPIPITHVIYWRSCDYLYTDYTHVHWRSCDYLYTDYTHVHWRSCDYLYWSHTHVHWRSCDYVYWYFDLDKIVVYMLVVTSLSVVRNETHQAHSDLTKETTQLTYLL